MSKNKNLEKQKFCLQKNRKFFYCIFTWIGRKFFLKKKFFSEFFFDDVIAPPLWPGRKKMLSRDFLLHCSFIIIWQPSWMTSFASLATVANESILQLYIFLTTKIEYSAFHPNVVCTKRIYKGMRIKCQTVAIFKNNVNLVRYGSLGSRGITIFHLNHLLRLPYRSSFQKVFTDTSIITTSDFMIKQTVVYKSCTFVSFQQF